MLTFLPDILLGFCSAILFILNTLFSVTILMIVALLKAIIPIKFIRKIFSEWLVGIAENWVFLNNFFLSITTKVNWVVEGLEGLKPHGWYLVISNHQSNLDIVILQKIFYKKIPFLKFFLKKELFWVPFLGLAWWALDFPFMKRYSKEYLKKNPDQKGKDIETAKKACEKFKMMPISIVNFLEGTRYEYTKAQNQNSPFNHLLKPKAGGIGFVLSTMGNYLNNIIDVTIVYPNGKKSLWDFLCNRIREVRIKVDIIPINEKLLGDYVMDDKFREYFQEWVLNLWHRKDKIIDDLNH